MYNSEYEDYLRSVLGEENLQDDISNNTYEASDNQEIPMMDNIDNELEECYPDIYNIVYPMVQKACMKNTNFISRELVDDMVEEIYQAIEPNDSININVNIGNTTNVNRLSSTEENDNKPKPEIKSKYVQERMKEKQKENIINEMELPKETRQRNFLLNDLIKILVLRELLDRPGKPGNCPPQRPPMRPPYHGNRPPIMPRSLNEDYGFYEN